MPFEKPNGRQKVEHEVYTEAFDQQGDGAKYTSTSFAAFSRRHKQSVDRDALLPRSGEKEEAAEAVSLFQVVAEDPSPSLLEVGPAVSLDRVPDGRVLSLVATMRFGSAIAR